MIESLRHAAVIVLIAFGPMSATAANAAGSASAGATLDRTELAWGDVVPNERARAELWDVSVTEWRRYRQLMAGIRGSISPANLSPIEVLGIHARDDAERRRYAEQWAVMMREDAKRILAFQHAYDQANQVLYPDEPLIDPVRLPGRVEDEEALRATDRVLLFARPDCSRCDTVLERLVARINQIAGIDIYLSGIAPGDEQAIRDWAAARGIQPAWVRARRVTLNFEAGALAELAPAQSELPVLMLRRGETVTHLPEPAW